MKKVTGFVLVEREKLGTTAYRVNAALKTQGGLPLSREDGLATMAREVAQYPQRYDAATGTHTLVLLADERSGGAR